MGNSESIAWHHQILLKQGLITMAKNRAKELAEVYSQIDQVEKTFRVFLMRLIVSTQDVFSKKRENKLGIIVQGVRNENRLYK